MARKETVICICLNKGCQSCVPKRLILRSNMSNNLCCIAQSGEFKDHAREDMSLYLLTERTVIVCHPLYKLKYPSICKM